MTKLDFAIKKMEHYHKKACNCDTFFGAMWLSECYEFAIQCMKDKKADLEGRSYIKQLEDEVKMYREAAALYGVDAKTMLTLAKSQIKTCADNIRMTEHMDEISKIFEDIPDDLELSEISTALAEYDGDGSKPYCDLVYLGLRLIYDLTRMRGVT